MQTIALDLESRLVEEPMLDFNLIRVVPATDADYEFSFQVKKQAQGPWITMRWGWDEEKQRAFHRQDWDQKQAAPTTA